MWDNLHELMNANSNFETAVMRNDLDEVKRAISVGADVNYSVAERSMIYTAAYKNQWEIVEFLLDEGANVNTANGFHNRLVHQIAEKGSLELFERVISLGAVYNCYDLDKETPFLTAVKKNRHNIVDYMLDDLVGVDLTSTDNLGKNTLHYCAELGHKDMFMKLWYQGVDISITDQKGNTAIDYIRDEEWKNQLPELEKEVSEIKQIKETEAAKEEKVVESVKDTLKATGISSIKRRTPKPSMN